MIFVLNDWNLHLLFFVWKVVEKDAETDRKKAIIEAEKESQVAQIHYQQKIMEKESLQRIAQIEDEMHLARQKSYTDAEYYKSKQQAEVNKILYTPQYLELKKYESLSQNTKVYFGTEIPQTYLSTYLEKKSEETWFDKLIFNCNKL